MTSTPARLALVTLQCAVAIGLCWIIFRKTDIGTLGESLRKIDLWSLAIATLLLLIERLIRPYRLAILLGNQIAPLQVIAMQSVSQIFNLVLPLRSGEIFLVAALRFLGHSSGSYALSIVAIDRLMDVVCVLAIFAGTVLATLGLPDYVGRAAYVLAGISAVATAGMLALVLLRSKVIAQSESAIGRFAGADRAKRWRARFEQIIEGFSVLLDPRRLLLALLATVLTWTCDVLGTYLILGAVWPGAPVMAALLAVCLSVIGMTLVSVPAGIGIMHAAFAMGAMAFGATRETGLAFAIVGHFLAVATTLLMGVAGFFIAKSAGLSLWLRMAILARKRVDNRAI